MNFVQHMSYLKFLVIWIDILFRFQKKEKKYLWSNAKSARLRHIKYDNSTLFTLILFAIMLVMLVM